MGLLDSLKNFSADHGQVTGSEGHKGNITHSLLASAVAYEAAKAYEQHVAKNGKPSSHAKATEVTAAIIGGVVDHLVETKGLDFIDKQKAKHDAAKHVDEVLVTEYQT